MNEVAIVGAARTPIGAYGGSLKDVPAYRLAAIVLNASLAAAGLEPRRVDDVILGQSYQNGESVNIGRMALLAAGWPEGVTGVTLDRRCCSGLDAVFWGMMKIQTGNAEVIVAGGVDSMSLAELYIPGDIKWGLGGRSDSKWGLMPRGHGALALWGIPLFDRIQRARVMSQPVERYGELNSMMTWAETAAQKERISREMADAWAMRSHLRAVAAIDTGKFKPEITPVPLPSAKGSPVELAVDETPRRDVTIEKLARLRPIYPDGVCTAGNSSTENDGAAAVVLMSEFACRKLGIQPLAILRSVAVAGTDPALTYPAVPAAVEKALRKAGVEIAQMDLIEIQEAFAVQALADAKLMKLAPEEVEAKVNVNGSGISLGHPIGATGTMRLITLIHEMARRGARFGLETICGGGGQGIAAVIERRS
jgi:acetyl-CoA C-acetyltransferase